MIQSDKLVPNSYAKTVSAAHAQGPIVETERLILRPPAIQDFDSWAEFMADPEATRFLGGVQPRSISWRGMMAVAGSWALLGYGMFSVIEKETGKWVGRLGPWKPEGWPGAEVGYGLARSAWGKGYAKEGVTASINWAFENLGWTEIIHCIDVENVASQRVAKSIGSRVKGVAKLPAPYELDQLEVWGQSREEWYATRG